MIDVKNEVSCDMKGLDELILKLKSLEKSWVEYGYYDNDTHDASGLPMSQLAAYTEFGNEDGTREPRPFMAQSGIYFTLTKMNIVKLWFRRFQEGKQPPAALLGRIGVSGVQQIKETIMYQNFPKLKPSTIKKKGNDTILIETGEMEKSAKFFVKNI